MKLSRREMVIGAVTMFTLLFGFTYWLGGTRIEEQRDLTQEKERLLRQIELHKRILDEQENWTGRLEELKAQLPVYNRRVSVTGEILKTIKGMADQNGLDLTKSRSAPEEQVGTLYELSVSCDWEGELDALVHFLYTIQTQGIRFEIRQLTIRPDAKRAGILRGDMTIDCAYRRSIDAES